MKNVFTAKNAETVILVLLFASLFLIGAIL